VFPNIRIDQAARLRGRMRMICRPDQVSCCNLGTFLAPLSNPARGLRRAQTIRKQPEKGERLTDVTPAAEQVVRTNGSVRTGTDQPIASRDPLLPPPRHARPSKLEPPFAGRAHSHRGSRTLSLPRPRPAALLSSLRLGGFEFGANGYLAGADTLLPRYC